MSLDSVVSRYANARTAIADAIKGKGVTVPTGSGFEDFAGLIDNIETGGGSSAPSDSLVWYKDFTFTSAVSSSAYVLLTQAELVEAGIVPNMSTLIQNAWTYFRVELSAVSVTHTTNMTVRTEAFSGFPYSSSASYYRQCTNHGNNASSVTTANVNSNMTTNTARYLYNATSVGLRYYGNTSYKLGVGTYRLTFTGIGKK